MAHFLCKQPLAIQFSQEALPDSLCLLPEVLLCCFKAGEGKICPRGSSRICTAGLEEEPGKSVFRMSLKNRLNMN